MAFLSKTLMFFAFICLLLGLIFLTPIKYSIPSAIQKTVYSIDPKKRNQDPTNDPQALMEESLLCYQDADCVMTMCGQAPSCNSQVTNIFHEIQECPQQECPYQLDAYVKCEQNTCVIKRLLKPS